MRWFDTHAHLQDEKFSTDFEKIIKRSLQADVLRILLPGADLESSQRAVELSVKYPDVLCCSVGIHPHDASQADGNSIEIIKKLLDEKQKNRIVAVGEVGLDYHYDFSPRDIQKKVFQQFIELASVYDLPLIIHNRESTEDCIKILKKMKDNGILRNIPGVFHCFSGSPQTAEILLDMGFYLGFDGPITFKNAKKAAEVIKLCPKERLLIETDSPYLTPEPFRGRRNEPSYLKYVGNKMADILQMEPEQIAELTFRNALCLFDLR